VADEGETAVPESEREIRHLQQKLINASCRWDAHRQAMLEAEQEMTHIRARLGICKQAALPTEIDAASLSTKSV